MKDLFVASKFAFQNWVRIHDFECNYWNWMRGKNVVWCAALHGLTAIVEWLLLSVARQGELVEALYAASQGGHKNIVEMVIEKRANVNAQGGQYGNALQAAPHWGHNNIVELLIEKGANVNAQGGFYGNALQAASQGGHKNIVELLLEKGVNVNAQGGEYGNALQAASQWGHINNIVELLIEKGACTRRKIWKCTSSNIT